MPAAAGEAFNCSSTATLTQFVSIARDADFNVTASIMACPETCARLWGVGNSDLDGIGTNISWIIQSSLVGMFSSFSIFIPILESQYYSSPHRGQMNRLLYELRLKFLVNSAFVALSVFVATIVWLKQQEEVLFELTFLYYLNSMQLLTLFGEGLSTILPPKEIAIPAPSMTLQVFVVFTSIIGLVLYINIILMIQGALPDHTLLLELTAACRVYAGIVPDTPENGSSSQSIKQFITLVINFEDTPAKRVVAGVVLVLLAIYVGGYVLWFLMNLSFPIYRPICSSSLVIGVLVCLVQMQKSRNTFMRIRGPDWVDSRWSIGQIFSVFVWSPTVWDVVTAAVEIGLYLRVERGSDIRSTDLGAAV